MVKLNMCKFKMGCGLFLLMGMLCGMSVEAANLEATLIYASEDPASLDTRMDRIEYKLRRLFKFEHYQLMDQKTALLGPRSETDISFSAGYSLHLTTGAGSEKGFPATIVWKKGGRALMSTGVSISKGRPTILGGPAYKNGTLILAIELK